MSNILAPLSVLKVKFIVEQHRVKNVQRVKKTNESTKSFVERLVDIIIDSLLVLEYIGSTSAPDEATFKEKAHALQCTTEGSSNAILAELLRVGFVCGLGIDVLGTHTLSLAARY